MSLFKTIAWSPKNYVEASVLSPLAGEEMLSRLQFITIEPKVIVDMGCGAGEMSARLKERYPDAKVVSLDASFEMIAATKENLSSRECLCADAEKLPFADQSVDFIFANFMLPWHANVKVLLREWKRVLRPNGLLMFTAFGPDTLKEWQPIFARENMPACVDMHDTGDLLLEMGFADPVLDVDYYTLSYRQLEKFYTELYDSGMISTEEFIHRQPVQPDEEGAWQATFEVIYAHAFTPEKGAGYSADHDGTAKIPLASLRRKLRGS